MATTSTAQTRRLQTAHSERYLDTVGAAEFLDLSPAFIRSLRTRGEGPSHFRVGRRILYAPGDLRTWVERFRVGR